MKLLSYGLEHRMEPRLAFLLNGQAVDVMRASLWMKEERGAIDFLNLPSSMKLALENWEKSFSLLKALETAALSLDFESLNIFGRPLSMPLADIAFFAPIPDPPSLRYFQASQPDGLASFTFGNTQTLLGHNQILSHAGLSPKAELAAIIAAKKEDEHCSVAGYCVLNNWFDPSLSENDGLSYGKASSLGPYFVTADELEPHKLGSGFSLDLQLRVNGQVTGEGRFRDMQLGFEEMITQAKPTRVLAGDVFCSGSPFGLDKGIAMKSGDKVEIEVQVLGTLSTRVE